MTVTRIKHHAGSYKPRAFFSTEAGPNRFVVGEYEPATLELLCIRAVYVGPFASCESAQAVHDLRCAEAAMREAYKVKPRYVLFQ